MAVHTKFAVQKDRGISYSKWHIDNKVLSHSDSDGATMLWLFTLDILFKNSRGIRHKKSPLQQRGAVAEGFVFVVFYLESFARPLI